MRRLEWFEVGDGVLIARARRGAGGKYQISTRLQPDGSGDLIYGVVRLVPSGSRQSPLPHPSSPRRRGSSVYNCRAPCPIKNNA
jgi:hypothetical protein